MSNPNEWNDRLHDHYAAIARERDHANRVIATLEKQIEELQDELHLAHEALRRAFPENQA